MAKWWQGKLFGLALWLGGVAAIAAPAPASTDLRIGFKAEVTSADPHVLNGQNRNVWAHVYESLTVLDAQLRPQPALALSWRALDATHWEFTLRPNVRFHNGAILTADDVRYSILRALHLGGTRTFRTYLRGVVDVTVTGPLTVRVTTAEPNPTIPNNLGLIAILPQTLGKVEESSFASGASAIGTGPYTFASWSHGQNVTLARFDGYWGAREPWRTVTFQFIPREPARASALLSGSVDLIDAATASLAYSFKQSGRVDVSSVTSYMLNYLALDQFRDNSPFITGNDGAPLAKNPLRDLRVRRALALAINRDVIIEHLMKTDATPSTQLVPAGFLGYDASLTAPPQDQAKARALLAEAGYPKGFRMTVHCPSNRYINDVRNCEALAQMFTRVGVTTEISALPFSVYLGRIAGTTGKSDFSAFLIGYGAVTGDSLTALTSSVHTRDRKAGLGANNDGGYSNRAVDAIIDEAAHTFDPAARAALQVQATRLALADAAIIPLLHLNATWAMRKGLRITPRADGFTMAMDIREQTPANVGAAEQRAPTQPSK
jgi:peptide/nickel transport system substrate-binding protein